MSHFFLDSSALVKRYLTETGTPWIDALADPSDGISLEERDQTVALLLGHCETEYQVASLNPAIFSRAVSLTQNHRLRGYDAVQLATALEVNDSFTAADFPALIFVAADEDLVAAAQSEGLDADDPNHHS